MLKKKYLFIRKMSLECKNILYLRFTGENYVWYIFSTLTYCNLYFNFVTESILCNIEQYALGKSSVLNFFFQKFTHSIKSIN